MAVPWLGQGLRHAVDDGGNYPRDGPLLSFSVAKQVLSVAKSMAMGAGALALLDSCVTSARHETEFTGGPAGEPLARGARFGRFELRPAERQLLDDRRPVPLGSRAFDVLQALVERRDRVTGKNELLEIAWPGVVVEENNLTVQVSALRKLLGPQAIATIPGRGYRVVAPLHGEAPAAALVQMADTDRIRWRVERSVGQEMSKLTNVDELFEGRHFDREMITCACGGTCASSSACATRWR